MRTENRIWAAFGGASLAVAIVLGSVAPLGGVRSIASVAVSILVLLPYSGAFLLGVGGPLYLVVRRLGYVRWWSAILGGGIGGVLSAAIFALPNDVSSRALLLWGSAGLAAGITFWLMYPRSENCPEVPHEV